ncbi:phosphoethanolamine--lipid A transferase, partial [Ursidibacter maritimus]
VLTIPLVLFCALIIVIQILSLPILHKVIIPFLLIISSAISYNEIFFSIFFDKDMLDNVLQTNTAESMRMMTTSYISWIVILGIIPSLLYIATKVKYKSFLREIMTRIATILLSMLIILGVAKFFYQDYASFFRNNKNVAHLILPSNFVASSIKKIRHLQRENIPYTQIDVDAQQEKPDNYRHVTVLIVGETTRAQNWGLNGYKRQTTPLLAKRGEEIFNFSKVSSCGTATAISVPCMFSAFTRENYDAAKAAKQDNILDILQRSNIDLMWIDNNSDCKGVCERIPNKTVINLNLPEFCRNGECLDNIMLPELDKVLDEQNEKDLVVILHTIGSHGPTYYERYTKEYRHFEPTCDTNEINRCNDQQLVNTYDNTIVYQDQFIDKVIQRLENKDNWESAVFYVSDHGESLGESGIYLHGAPYSIAPDYQTKVPMIMWFSKAFLKNEPFDFECLRENSQKQNYSHDNLFHTMFSLMDMDTDLGSYNVHLDILAQCKK